MITKPPALRFRALRARAFWKPGTAEIEWLGNTILIGAAEAVRLVNWLLLFARWANEKQEERPRRKKK